MKRMKKQLISLTLALVLLTGLTMTTYADDTSDLKTAYANVMLYASQHDIDLSMTYLDFLNGYTDQSYDSVSDYEEAYYDAIYVSTSMGLKSSGGSDEAYYYNTGTSCPSDADYSEYNLCDIVEPGDIIFEAEGFYGLTGHTAIVEGVFTDSDGNDYIRIIEALTSDGVVRSILDDTRFDDRDDSIYRVTSASSDEKDTAIDFCLGEIGSSYALDFAKDTSSSETDWYCSELVWAGYMQSDIDIETTGWYNEPGVTPRDITVNGNNVDLIY